MKLWDLATQHCLETIVTHRAELTAMIFDLEESLLITFGADQQICVFKASLENISRILSTGPADGAESIKVFVQVEIVDRSSKDRVVSVAVKDDYICILSSDKSIEVLRANYKSDSKKAKAAKKMFSSVHHSKFSDKPCSLDVSSTWSLAKHSTIKVILNFTNNSIQEWCIPLDRQSDKEKIAGVEFAGHRTDVKSVCMTSDGSLIASVSSEAVKVWNASSGSCIRSFVFDDGTASSFVPGDKHVLVASKAGLVNVFELVSGSCIMSVEAHTGAIWSLQVAPDQKGFITGGADKSVKFWEFKKDKNTGGLAKIKHIKTLQLSDEVLAVKYSPDMRLLAISLLDMTVKVFFEDSLKLSLSLYGHKLPVTSLDISHDSSTIVTVSADKNVKIWSLQFGDCRKSIFAHQEPITFVSFLGASSEFITASKDSTIRYWDANKFVALQKLTGHHGEVMAAVLNRTGDVLVTASMDKSIRIWQKSEELLFPEEEQEKELDETIDASIIAENPHASGEDASTMATKTTVSAMKAGERIIEAIEVANIETQKAIDQAVARENGITLELQAPEPLLLAAGRDKTPAELVMWAVNQVPLAELEEALLALPLSLVRNLLNFVIEWYKNRLNLVVACRVLNLLLKVHYNQIIANSALRVQLETLRQVQAVQLKELKDAVGYNIAAMKHIIQ